MTSRTSTYPLPAATSFDFLTHLEDCIRATETCSSALSSGLNRLQPGVSDLPRLTKVLTNKHHYLVLPHPTIIAHKSALSTSLAPQIDQLITKAELLLQTESNRVKRLEGRLGVLQSARLPLVPRFDEQDSDAGAGSGRDDGVEGVSNGEDLLGEEDGSETGTGTGSKLEGLVVKELSHAQRRKVIMLKAKRERLERERARLTG